MLSEILPHLISPKSTFCKIFTLIKYTNSSLFSSHAFPKVSVRYFIYKKVLRFKKINAIEIEVGNVGIGKNRISIIECVRIKQIFNFSQINFLQKFYSNQVYKHSLFSSHAFPKVSVRYFIYKKSSQVQKNKCNIPRNRGP